jgi:hypothetical protein
MRRFDIQRLLSRARPRRRRSDETWQEMRGRIVGETNAWLTECLKHPEHATRIPVVEANKARFPRSMTPAFWDGVLFDRE